jgi:hypothetical protein
MATILLQIRGLRSPDDEQRLESALRAQKGVYGAVASRQDGCAEIDVDDDMVTIAHLVDVAAAAGFPASPIG